MNMNRYDEEFCAKKLGDTFHSAVQMDHPEWTVFIDSEPELAKDTRRKMLRELAIPSTVGIGTHISSSVFGRLIPAQGKLQWQIEQ